MLTGSSDRRLLSRQVNSLNGNPGRDLRIESVNGQVTMR